MPDPPAVSPLTRYLFDNPWPLTILLLLTAACLLVAVRNTGQRRYLRAAVLVAALAIVVVIVERFVITSGEYAMQVTTKLALAAEKGDVGGAQRLFANDAIMSLIDPQNPGVGIDTIHGRLEMLRGRYQMKSNAITSLGGYSTGPARGIVHLRLRSDFESGMGYPVFSSWVIEVQQRPGGQWLISQLTFVEYNKGQRPDPDLF